MKSAIICAALALLAGCATGPSMVVLQHPDTKQMAQCKAEQWDMAKAEHIEACIKGYEAAGFKMLNSY
ncbi:MAG: hypothetical protein WCJ64_13440 [Rhodospirillaceae bacterium]